MHPATDKSNRHGHSAPLLALVISAIGVVYGDIGTSPLYALKEVFSGTHGVPLNRDNVVGVVSLMLWLIVLVVGLKYVTLILRADNNGEGGIMAMIALAGSAVGKDSKRYPLIVGFGLVGAALFYGDGVITPAISVLSAVEGLEVATPIFKPYVLPIVVVVLTVLYLSQKRGTGKIGVVFGPIMLLWFATLAGLGLYNIAIGDQAIWQALNPYWAYQFAMTNRMIAFVALGAIVLCVTGGEALYADMGHFGARPIRYAWFFYVFPALVLNYLGQGALILSRPESASNPFFNQVPQGFVLPLVLLSTAAAVIASQATISGTFSLTRQAIQLGFLPRMRVEHTSAKSAGQIYIPFVNWAQYVLVVATVLGFGSSSNMAAAYGTSVTGSMLIETIMTFFVIRFGWKMALPLCIAATGLFLVVDLLFFTANSLKIPQGGWFPLALAGVVLMLMLTWLRGRTLIRKATESSAIPLTGFLQSLFLSPPVSVEGTAVYLNAKAGIVPRALMHNLLHNKVLHERNVFLTVRYTDVPWVSFSDRMTIEPLGNDCWAIQVRYGFKNIVDIPKALELAKSDGLEFDPMMTSYFLSSHHLVSDDCKGMPPWQAEVFAAMLRNASAPAEFLGLPTNRVIELGAQVRI